VLYELVKSPVRSDLVTCGGKYLIGLESVSSSETVSDIIRDCLECP
jgi:hypothetical protein